MRLHLNISLGKFNIYLIFSYTYFYCSIGTGKKQLDCARNGFTTECLHFSKSGACLCVARLGDLKSETVIRF